MNLINIPELARKNHKGLAEYQIRRLCWQSKSNGLQACKAVIMDGKKVQINEALFLSWQTNRLAEKEARRNRPKVSKRKLNKIASGPWPCPTK